MISNKFHFHQPSIRHAFSVFPPRPQTLLNSHPSPAPALSYWSRPHTSASKLPVVFLHGIGIGLYPYVNFLAELNPSNADGDGDVGIIAVEILNISFRITNGTLGKDEFCRQLLAILEHHGYDQFVLVSHS
jgi:pimeloyl-ACP methyl ester carboxylesterase